MDGDDAKKLADGVSDVVVAGVTSATEPGPEPGAAPRLPPPSQAGATPPAPDATVADARAADAPPAGTGPAPPPQSPAPPVAREAGGAQPERRGLRLRDLLISILAPTLALFGVAIGVIGNAISEANAREREDEIRRAELVLPVYEAVIEAEDAVETAVFECERARDAWWTAPSESEAESAALARVQESCDFVAIFVEFEKLDSALERALLVSDESLLDVAGGYGSATAAYVDALSTYTDLIRLEIETFDTGEPPVTEEEFEDVLADLTAAQNDLADAKTDLFDAIREQVLP